MKKSSRMAPLAVVLLLPLLAGSGPDRQARPIDLPTWAEQGAFRFIRLDGGRIETMKAQRTWWGKNFSADEYDILAHAYDTHFDQLLDRLRQARFNWIWVTWSNGWSVETEAENREALARVIRRCHAEGIRVTAYLSAANTFWLDAYRRDPATIPYGLWYGPVPVFYAGNPEGRLEINFQRRMADARYRGWRDYLIRKAGLALDVGADAIFYDNLIGDTRAFEKLLAETQELARQKAAATGRPKALVYANVHLGPGRFNLCDQGEVVWMEDGKDTPGLYPGFWQIEGARKISFLRGEKLRWQPLMFENDVHHCGHRERCIPPPEQQKLQMAEARAFGAELSRNLEGRFLAGLVREEPEALAAWSAIAQYNRFFAEHEHLYRGTDSPTAVGLVCRREDDPLADALIRASAQFETKVWGHLEDGVPLRQLRTLVVNELPPRLSVSDLALLREFLANGGKILASDPATLSARSRGQLRAGIHPLPGAEAINRLKLGAGNLPPETLSALAGDSHRLEISGGTAVLTRAVTAADGALLIHLLNYDYGQAASGLRIRVDFPGQLAGATIPKPGPPTATGTATGRSVSALSPDGPPEVEGIEGTTTTLAFTLDRLDRYAVVVIR